MNYHYILFLNFFFGTLCVLGQPQIESNRNRLVKIDTEKSTIEILGKTNVNEFGCYYQTTFLQDSFHVEVTNFSSHKSLGNAKVKLKVKDFQCDNSQMTKDFRELLSYDEHPSVTIQLQKLKSIAPGKYLAETVIQLAGQHQLYSLKLNVSESQEGLFCSGAQKIDITDFGLQAPEKFFGMVKVSKDIVINFNIYLELL
ncbi:hypothetical protein GCM10011506_25940 [Marivirga lumbricoides]|uniref:Lipid/polyisoprenoid-binding YceI-like domain-containing protein n=1 Tax=Marivirga lumbricoides TaxID=1046115 RepID=A0ABQ1MEL8_9BACT|nr:hypothetical protein GCM10011506_25940 [Marivirga lumbricoides]